MLGPILIVKQLAPFRQYNSLYSGGQVYVCIVILGRTTVVEEDWLGGRRGFGVERLEHASTRKEIKEVNHQST